MWWRQGKILKIITAGKEGEIKNIKDISNDRIKFYFSWLDDKKTEMYLVVDYNC